MAHLLVAGASGTAGQGVVRAALAAGHGVTCALRPGSDWQAPEGAGTVAVDWRDPAGIETALAARPVDAVISAMASRTGEPADAWAVDHAANMALLDAAGAAGVSRFVLVSAICVQKPKLEFQRAKLAFEAALMESGMDWTIVRPTAFFKSLSGQVARVKAGKPFLVFGDGTLTACKPVSDDDLGRFIVGCLADPAAHDAILPIGGPGPAITPLDQAAMLAELTGKPVKLRNVPLALLDTIIASLSLGGRFSKRLAAKAELARIGRYYATESMLVWDAKNRRYDADATPQTGTETLRDHYRMLLEGDGDAGLREHGVFR